MIRWLLARWLGPESVYPTHAQAAVTEALHNSTWFAYEGEPDVPPGMTLIEYRRSLRS